MTTREAWARWRGVADEVRERFDRARGGLYESDVDALTIALAEAAALGLVVHGPTLAARVRGISSLDRNSLWESASALERDYGPRAAGGHP